MYFDEIFFNSFKEKCLWLKKCIFFSETVSGGSMCLKKDFETCIAWSFPQTKNSALVNLHLLWGEVSRYNWSENKKKSPKKSNVKSSLEGSIPGGEIRLKQTYFDPSNFYIGSQSHAIIEARK